MLTDTQASSGSKKGAYPWIINALLVLPTYLSPLVYRPNFANGMSVFLVMAVWPPLLGAAVLLVSGLNIPTHPLFWGFVAGLAFWFGHYAKGFARTHQATILALSQTRPWPRMRAVALFVLSFLLFTGLLKTAAWIDG